MVFERLSKLNELVVELRDSMDLLEEIALRDNDVGASEILQNQCYADGFPRSHPYVLRLGTVVRLHAIHCEVSILVRSNRAPKGLYSKSAQRV